MDITDYIDTKKYVITIILIIYDAQINNEEINNERIWRSIGCSKTTIYDRVKKLVEFGVIERIVMGDQYPIMKLNRLTDYGIQIAQILNQLRELHNTD